MTLYQLSKPSNGKRAMGKVSVDIEDLLVWAYRDQCVDRMARQMSAVVGGRPPGMPSLSAIMVGQIALGCRVDSSPRHTALLGATAPDDALIVHDAVLALDDAYVEIDGARSWLWDRAHAASEGCVIEDGVAGSVLRRPGGGLAGLDRIVTSVEIIRHARGAMRPECYAGWRLHHDGKVRHERSRGIDTPGVTVRDIVRARAVYGLWRMALMVLAADLKGVLERWEAIGPAVADSPWVISRGRPKGEKQGVMAQF